MFSEDFHMFIEQIESLKKHFEELEKHTKDREDDEFWRKITTRKGVSDTIRRKFNELAEEKDITKEDIIIICSMFKLKEQ